MVLTTPHIDLQEIVKKLKATKSVMDKVQIARTHELLGQQVDIPFVGERIEVGDDCAAIPDGHGSYLLFAAEGIVQDFVEHDPWFAGYSAVMVNISDVCAMGGIPIAVSDVIWAQNKQDSAEIWKGMMAASKAYGVPIVGGHTCYESPMKSLSVSILGKSDHLLTSYHAQAGDLILMVYDPAGAYHKNYPFWNASTTASPDRLKKLTQFPKLLADHLLSKTAKDISMGGIIGTLAMLLRTSGVGAEVYLDKIPQVDDDFFRWLCAFPSFGFLFAVQEDNLKAIQKITKEHDLVCASIGVFTHQKALYLSANHQKIKF